MNKKVSKKDIAQLLKTWSQQFNVLAPSRDSGVAAMAEWDGKDTSFLDWYRNTVVPPKASFLPPMEAMFRFRKDEEGYQIEPPAKNGQKQLLFGIRPCDARAMAILDMTFEDAYKDPYYLEKRKKAVLVGLGCTNPCESCFCTSMGTSPTDPTNVDLMLIDIGDHFFIEEVTAKGKELIAKTSGLKEATKNDEAEAEKARETAYNKVSRKLDTEGIKDNLLESFDDEDFWEKVAAKCISCGICTLLCPTCYCFDINDELVKGEGTRFRSWDSCGFSLYTKMPMENPRQEKWRRVRQKVCHKYEFYPMAFDVIACTGCGRCIRLCPVNWDITQVIESVPARVKGAK
ncbi:MAG: 4Fe-4S dicluster domain-containing protein [Dehalococcoidales bacterium]|nr:4Fe-4S dicluster domain-containing protein [Dehalococcoidales bacterium]